MNRVLVTGCPRSGTTFVGSVLASAPRVAYLHEPLNPDCGLPSASHRFADLADPSSAAVADEMLELFELRGRLRGNVYPTDTAIVRLGKRLVAGRGPLQLAKARALPRREHVVVKDPFAMRSIEWFEAQGCTVIVMVRHPAAVVASMRRLGWKAGTTMRRFAAEGLLDDVELDWVDQLDADLDGVALFWRMNYRAALAGLGDGRLVVHELMSARPSEAIAELRAATGIPWSDRSERRLRRLTSGDVAAADPAGRTQQFRRASADILGSTISTLTADELDRIWAIAGDIASRWYRPDGLT
ncbi:sulfotransferase family protein [Ilumatobacter fluminis]|uniref:Sulfotransferase family protein n=1 Tax=Ilumatobacter fluminis TaxID=467091 RepID=A0A4R7HYM7_9ACTN|nr:sulfotransferase [Ilumatobacter fluminis]TDT15619.1 sulfotransferase family protein [Ilumatobacter fluminis]